MSRGPDKATGEMSSTNGNKKTTTKPCAVPVVSYHFVAFQRTFVCLQTPRCVNMELLSNIRYRTGTDGGRRGEGRGFSVPVLK